MIMIVVTKRQKDKNTNRQNKSNKKQQKIQGARRNPTPSTGARTRQGGHRPPKSQFSIFVCQL